MEDSGRARRLTGSTDAAGLLPCCESWLAEQLLGEVKRTGRRAVDPAADPGLPTDAGAVPAEVVAAESRPDIGLVQGS